MEKPTLKQERQESDESLGGGYEPILPSDPRYKEHKLKETISAVNRVFDEEKKKSKSKKRKRAGKLAAAVLGSAVAVGGAIYKVADWALEGSDVKKAEPRLEKGADNSDQASRAPEQAKYGEVVELSDEPEIFLNSDGKYDVSFDLIVHDKKGSVRFPIELYTYSDDLSVVKDIVSKMLLVVVDGVNAQISLKFPLLEDDRSRIGTIEYEIVSGKDSKGQPIVVVKNTAVNLKGQALDSTEVETLKGERSFE